MPGYVEQKESIRQGYKGSNAGSLQRNYEQAR